MKSFSAANAKLRTHAMIRTWRFLLWSCVSFIDYLIESILRSQAYSSCESMVPGISTDRQNPSHVSITVAVRSIDGLIAMILFMTIFRLRTSFAFSSNRQTVTSRL